jgi:hypothetical protein
MTKIHCKKAMSECAKFRCLQRWRRTKGCGSGNFPTPTSFGSRHRCPHRNFAQLFFTVYPEIHFRNIFTKLEISIARKHTIQYVQYVYI